QRDQQRPGQAAPNLDCSGRGMNTQRSENGELHVASRVPRVSRGGPGNEVGVKGRQQGHPIPWCVARPDQEDVLPTLITRQELQARLDRADRPVLVEGLGGAFFADAHLPGAVNIPPGNVDRLAPRRLPDRDAPIVVYCSGSCSSADAVARRLEAVGYTNVA